MDYKLNGNIIADYIQKNGLTKSEFCKRCKISVYTLERIMRNENVRLTDVVRVARELKIKLSELFE